MDDHIEEGSMEEEDEGSDSSFFCEGCRFFMSDVMLVSLRLCGSACVELVTGTIQRARQSELTRQPFL